MCSFACWVRNEMRRLEIARNMIRSSKWLVTALVPLLLFAWHCHGVAAQVTVGFETLSGVDFSLLEPVPDSAKLSNQLAATFGVVFRSEGSKPYVAVVNHGGYTNSPFGTRAIVAVDENDLLSYQTPIIVEFVRPSDPSIAATTDFVSIRGILVPRDGDMIIIEAF